MDPILSKIYGTSNEASDLEKLASAQMAEELSEDEGVNVDGASDGDIEQLAQAVLNDIQGDAEEEPAAKEDSVDDETMAKVAEADKLGRVMAHSMWQELNLIKQAAYDPLPSSYGGSDNKATAHEMASKPAKSGSKGEAVMAKVKEVGAKVKDTAQRAAWAAQGAAGHAAKAVKNHPGKAGLAAGALAVGGAMAAKHKMDKKKQSSALETLAEARALEILEANGIDPASLEPVQEKVAEEQVDPAQRLSEAVEKGAWELLAKYGLEKDTSTEG